MPLDYPFISGLMTFKMSNVIMEVLLSYGGSCKRDLTSSNFLWIVRIFSTTTAFNNDGISTANSLWSNGATGGGDAVQAMWNSSYR